MNSKSSRRTSFIWLSVTLFCSLILILLGAHPAHAGYYSVSSTYTESDPQGGLWGGGNDALDYAGSAPVTSTVTTTFTWVPATGQTAQTDPPPTSAIVKQYSYAYCVNSKASGSSSDGLGDTDQYMYTYFTDGSVNTVTGVSTGTHYSVGDGGSSFQVTCTLSATGMNARLQYDASYFCKGSVVVTPQGGTTDTNSGDTTYNDLCYLTGSPISATVTAAGGADNLYAPTTPATYQWKILSGGGVFGNYVGYDGSEYDPNTGYVYQNGVLTSQPSSWSSTENSMTFYDALNEAVQYKCAVNFTKTSSNTNSNMPTTITVESQPVMVNSVKPSSIYWGVNEDVDDANGNIITPTFLAGDAGHGVHSYQATGTIQAWTYWYPIEVFLPSPFSGAAIGQVNQVQLMVSSTGEKTDALGTQSLYWDDAVGNVVSSWPALDNSFPYGVDDVLNSYQNSTGLYWTSDGPDIVVSAYDLTSGLGYYIQRQDSFKTWLMFNPLPGVCKWVPFEEMTWGWQGSETLHQNEGYIASGQGTVGSQSIAGMDFPIWSVTLKNGGSWSKQ